MSDYNFAMIIQLRIDINHERCFSKDLIDCFDRDLVFPMHSDLEMAVEWIETANDFVPSLNMLNFSIRKTICLSDNLNHCLVTTNTKVDDSIEINFPEGTLDD